MYFVNKHFVLLYKKKKLLLELLASLLVKPNKPKSTL